MRVTRDDVWLCWDCTIVAVNDDPSGINSDEKIKLVYEGLEKLGPYLVPSFDADAGKGCEEFSRRVCDCCGCAQAGTMHEFAILGES